MTAGAPHHDRLLELLADRAVQGLSAHDAGELERLLREVPGAMAEAEQLELAVAAAELAFAGERPSESMPPALRAKLESQASTWMASNSGNRATTSPDVIAAIRPAPKMGWSAASGWIAAAACLVIAAASWFGRGMSSPTIPNPLTARNALVSTASDLKQWGWTALGELEKNGVKGDACWSTVKQQGFMTFTGLPANDPTKEQYQLWIFDPAQSDKTPIDGGVFDVASANGTAVIPMDPKIRVSDAAMFAITIEKPGGVVVSDRSRLVLLAKPG